MVIAYDYKGTLDTYLYLTTMLKTFKEHEEHKMYILSAVPQKEYKNRLSEVEEFLKRNKIYLKHIIVLVPDNKEAMGKAKLDKMKEYSIDVLFDNEPVIVQIVKRGGRDAVLV